MPGVVMFKRRWGIGSDDLVFPGIGEIIFRFLWLIVLAVVYQIHKESFSCEKGLYLQVFYIGLIVITCLSILINKWIVYTSTRGTIANVEPRKWLPKILYLKLALGVFVELAWILLGTYFAFGDTSMCDNQVVLTMKIAVVTEWFVAVVAIVGIIIIFDPLGKRDLSETERDFQNAAKIWENRCKIICCCVARDDHSKGALTEIAQMLSDFFLGIDFVATDIAAGLILVQLDQERQKIDQELTAVLTPELRLAATSINEGVQTGVTGQNDWLNLHRVTHFMKFALSVYGWPMYMFSNLCCGPCKLWPNLSCCTGCCGRPQANGVVIDDNCCQCNMAAIKKTLGINDCDILHASFHNKIFEIPFFVGIDHHHKSIVVAIRGTLSLKDALTDMTAESEHVEIEELPDAQTEAHKGIMQAAHFVSRRLDELKILEQAFEQYKDYQLVITGHSLGAGAAACASVLLRPKYPNLVCYAFSPPGGLLSPPLAQYTQSFVCSVVLGKDLVPRLSLLGMEDLKVKVLQQIKDCHKPKYQILASGLWSIICGMPNEADGNSPCQPLLNGAGGSSKQYATGHEPGESDDADLVVNEDLPDGGEMTGAAQAHHVVEWILDGLIDEAILSSRHKRSSYPVLHPPGRIMHIVEDSDRKYIVVWKEAKEFDEIMVSPKMLTDHMPDRVYSALQDLCTMDIVPHHAPEMV
ncbi:diacylglycerol lipase-beta-like isoform X3 [Lineus longissimus]|uniref:diacylglycerol lipase-beta-like isoform X3 n=1 Tax=Lineus longissimus TaxID=88925 RepID=UPI00315CE96B